MLWMKALPWRLIGIGVGVGVLAAILWWTQSRIRISYQGEAAMKQHEAYRASVQESFAHAASKMQRDQLDDAEHAQRAAALEDEAKTLRAARVRLPATVETPNANGTTSVHISGPWWLCVSTSVSRDATDSAACQASAGNAVLPDPVRH